MKLSVVIPVYNEESTIESLVDRVDRVPVEKEIILVNDCSRDGTREKLDGLASRPNLRVFHHEVNQGKGAALRTGFAQARGDLVIIQDADLEYDPNEYPKLIQPILDGRADVVFGSRFAGGECHRVLYYWHSLGNRFLTAMSNMFTNLNLTDMETCYKVFRREILQSIPIEENRFGFEPEITAKVASRHCRVYEVGISYRGRTYEEGKKIGWKDGFRALWCILKYNTWKRLEPARAPAAPETPAQSGARTTAGAGISFWILGLILTLLVAFCTRHRDELSDTDGWEHHRAVKALVDDWPRPENPTVATADPSIRFSPYSVGLALLCRAGHLDPWLGLGAAAVLNTAMFIVGLYVLLRVYGQAAAGTCVLLVIVGLYGGAPGYANSLALADLPVHQVNPSAFGMAVGLFCWALFRRWAEPGLGAWILPVLSVLLAAILLSHGMTGIITVVGLVTVALTAPGRSRVRLIFGAAVVVALGLGLSLAWPWFSFWQALRLRPDNDYWYNPWILKLMLTRWCTPAILLLVAVLSFRRTELDRWSLLGAGACAGLTILAVLTKSATFARAPLAGLLFFQIPIGLFVHSTGLFRLSTWPARLGALVSRSPTDGAPAAVQTLTAAVLLACLVPQGIDVLREPHLARAYLAPLLHYENKQKPLKPLYEELLRGVGPKDVVLGDDVTAWPVPSVRGRIVSAEHYEFFVPGQAERDREVSRFFDPASEEPQRRELLDRYNVRWILISRSRQGDRTTSLLLEPSAVVREVGQIVLLDANAWRKARH